MAVGILLHLLRRRRDGPTSCRTNKLSTSRTIASAFANAPRRGCPRRRSLAFSGTSLTTSVLDGDVPYTVNPQGVARRASPGTAAALRIEMATHPVALVRLALDASSKVENLRTQGRYQLVDITLREGPRLTLATDPATGFRSG